VKALFDINVFAVMAMINDFIPLLIAAKGGGTIVNHGSMVRSLPHPFTAAYNASKSAVSQYSHTLRIELEPLGVKVIELVSGRVATGLITVPTLDESSIYKPLEPILQKRAREAETQQKAEVFAKAAAKSILEKPGNIEVFKGSIATIAWAITIGLRSNFRTIRIRRIFDELDRIELFLFSSTVRSN
jgi:1-acylglycerone phosphate reductase